MRTLTLAAVIAVAVTACNAPVRRPCVRRRDRRRHPAARGGWRPAQLPRLRTSRRAGPAEHGNRQARSGDSDKRRLRDSAPPHQRRNDCGLRPPRVWQFGRRARRLYAQPAAASAYATLSALSAEATFSRLLVFTILAKGSVLGGQTGRVAMQIVACPAAPYGPWLAL